MRRRSQLVKHIMLFLAPCQPPATSSSHPMHSHASHLIKMSPWWVCNGSFGSKIKDGHKGCAYAHKYSCLRWLFEEGLLSLPLTRWLGLWCLVGGPLGMMIWSDLIHWNETAGHLESDILYLSDGMFGDRVPIYEMLHRFLCCQRWDWSVISKCCL